MLIVNHDHLTRSVKASLDHCYLCCGEAYAAYPLIMSDDASHTVYHVACALELATDLLVDLYAFFHPWGLWCNGYCRRMQSASSAHRQSVLVTTRTLQGKRHSATVSAMEQKSGLSKKDKRRRRSIEFTSLLCL